MRPWLLGLIITSCAVLSEEGRGAFSFEPDSIAWETSDARLVAADPGSTRAVADVPVLFRTAAVETTLTIEKPLNEQWKVAGLAMVQNDANYWQLALVQAPPEHGQRRYIELAESLDGQWNARNASNPFAWEYNHPYRLRLELAPDGIRGSVREADGTERATLAFRFDCPSVTNGRPALASSGFRAAFESMTASGDDRTAIRDAPPKFPACNVKGSSVCRERATGFFRAARVRGRDWLFTPGGEAFYAVGTDHVNYGAHWCESLGYAPYHRNVARLFGSEPAWATNALRRLHEWGFNLLATGNSESLRHQGLPHVEFLGLGTAFGDLAAMVPKENWTGFPNVFDERFAPYCDKVVRRRCAAQRDNPWLLGYFIDNELQWFGKAWNTTLRASALQLPAGNPARLVAEKTGDDEFTRLAAEKYFAVTTAAIRKHDPNHLILGCRFAGAAPTNVWAIAGKHCDIVSLNIYPRLDIETLDTGETEALLRECHARAGKPIMITEWSFPALDATDTDGRPLPCKHGAGMRVDTQEQKARCCEALQRLFFRLPFVVGSDFFMWADEPSRGISKAFPEDSNYGLVSETDRPYETVVKMFAGLNADVYAIHSGSAAAPPRARRPAPPEGPRRPAGAVRIERDGDRITVNNGVLRLVKDKPDGYAWNRVEMGGVLLGQFSPLVHQKLPQDLWSMPQRVTRIAVSNQVVEMTFEHPDFRTAYRFTILPGQNWFTSQLLWIENAGAKAWRLTEYYHYATTKRGDEPGGPGVPNYYLPFASWLNKDAGKQYGVVALGPDTFRVDFWLDEQGGQHPDARRIVDRDLAPGERYAEPQPAIVVFGADAGERPAALVQRIRAEAVQ